MNIYFFDTETTGGEAKDRIIQLGVKKRSIDTPVMNELFKPPLPISIESMAVHHIVPEMVESEPAFVDSSRFSEMKELFESDENYVVAHNSAFDVAMLAKEGVHPKNVICTLKVARNLDHDEKIPRFGLQYLRYFLKLRIDGVVPHDAWGDVVVLEHVFERLFKKMVETCGSEKAALDAMVQMTSRPTLLKTIRFGKHNGKRIEDLVKEDPGYLQWLLKEKEKTPEGEEDWIYSLKVALGILPLQAVAAPIPKPASVTAPRPEESSIPENTETKIGAVAPAAAPNLGDLMSHFKPASAFTAPKHAEKKEEELPTIIVE